MTVIGGTRRSVVGVDGVGDQSPVEQVGVQRLGVDPVDQRDAEQQAPAADVDDTVDRAEPVGEPTALSFGERRGIDPAHLGDHRVHGRGGDRRPE